ncbi:MAG: signal peptidase II [Verrucomicrobiota bacterium JB023]|nr:signal peptidase II [Verrucomicrobiota bacterium JB023]
MSQPSFQLLGKLLLVISLPLYILDQISKWWVVKFFPEPPQGYTGIHPDDAITVIPGFFNLTRVHNQGVAFGFGNGTEWAPIVFLLVPALAVGLLLHFWKKGAFTTTSMKVACALLFSGIAGNVTDRLLQGFQLSYLRDASFWERFKAGYVVDFLDFTIPLINYRWPSFNVADSCISVAAVLLVVSSFREESS